MKKFGLCKIAWRIFMIFAILLAVTVNAGEGKSDQLAAGTRYQVIGPLYANSITHNLQTREVSVITLEVLRLSGPEVLSRQVVPVGSVMTIVGVLPRRFFSFLYPTRYMVRIDGVSLPVDVPVVIDIARGIEGDTTALNPKIFKGL